MAIADPNTSRKPRTRVDAASTRNAELLKSPIPFVSHPAFARRNAEDRLRKLDPIRDSDLSPPQDRPGLTFVAGFVSQPLLTPGEEESLFAWMNFHRYRAERLRRQALRDKSPRKFLPRIQRELNRSIELRNRIVSSNLRLVVSVAKKLSRSLDQMSELISEGVLPLIRAVELFDISLGNRFSTYATWAVRNQMLRTMKRSAARCESAAEISLESLPAPSADQEDAVTEPASALRIQRLISQLPDRERSVLRARFGLEGEPAGQSLADVASRVGLSKERVRQLVLKSLDQLRSQVTECA